MDNLHTQKTDKKAILTEGLPKIANFQVENQNQHTIDYKDESKCEDISMHTVEKHSTHHYYNPLKTDPSIFCTHLNMGHTCGVQIQISQINFLYLN